jgi:hypothetical protein
MRRIATLTAVFASLALPSVASAWPTWGNLDSSDCAFAAAANWEMLHGHTPSEPQILAEYREAAGPEDEGISGDTLEHYWRVHGIGGLRVTMRNPEPEAIARVLHHHGPVIAELAVMPMQRWGSTEDTSGGIHFVVVTTVNRRGPVILTWGVLAQMTWWQWREDALLLYAPS